MLRSSFFLLSLHKVASVLITVLLLSLWGCKGQSVDTTKTYYSDDEAPAFQVQVMNGVEKRVPWAEVPELQRYYVELGPNRKPKVRVPIVHVTTISLDAAGKPVPIEKAHRYEVTSVGLNPTIKLHSIGGNAH